MDRRCFTHVNLCEGSVGLFHFSLLHYLWYHAGDMFDKRSFTHFSPCFQVAVQCNPDMNKCFPHYLCSVTLAALFIIILGAAVGAFPAGRCISCREMHRDLLYNRPA